MGREILMMDDAMRFREEISGPSYWKKTFLMFVEDISQWRRIPEWARQHGYSPVGHSGYAVAGIIGHIPIRGAMAQVELANPEGITYDGIVVYRRPVKDITGEELEELKVPEKIRNDVRLSRERGSNVNLFVSQAYLKINQTI